MRIFKKDTAGKIRVLDVETNGGILIQRSGILDGKMVENSKMCIPTNVGRSNERNAEAQALFELDSLIKDKLDKGYFRSLEELKDGGDEVVMPMLAKDYKKEFKKVKWTNAFIQPKLDGMRCLAFVEGGTVELWSRSGKKIDTVPHIEEDILSLSVILGLEDVILDGELYCHGVSFQENMSLVKKYRAGETEKVKFNCYDMVERRSFTERYVENDMVERIISTSKHIVRVPTIRISSEADIAPNHEKNVGEGYEGSIIRWGNEPYLVNGRSSNLLKYKDFIDRTAVVVDVVPSDARPEQGVLVCRLMKEDGDVGQVVNTTDSFRSNLKFSHKEREEILTNKAEYIGKTAELRFFEYSDTGVPRFPVCVGFRLDK